MWVEMRRRSPGSRRRVVQRDEGEARAREAESRQQKAGHGDVEQSEAMARLERKRKAEGPL